MKKSQQKLLSLASKFQTKYADYQGLQDIIANAAGWGETSANGIMNFLEKLKADQATLRINVTVTGDTAEVSAPAVTPGDKEANYTKLPAQIKKYLDKNLKDFPQVPRGQAIMLEYTGTSPRVAQR